MDLATQQGEHRTLHGKRVHTAYTPGTASKRALDADTG